jgi:maltokinase
MIRIAERGSDRRAEQVTASGDGWAHSTPGDGAGLAVLHRLRNRMAVEEGFRVTMHAWVALEDESERAMGVDQTHESWVVGHRLVVKWMTDVLVGPPPAPERLRRLAEAGFTGSPALVGVIEWLEPDSGHWVPVVIVQEYRPGTVDGWTWALDDARHTLGLVPGPAGRDFGADVGDVVGRMHLALVDTPAERMTEGLARRYADEAVASLEHAHRFLARYDPESAALLAAHRPEIEAVLAGLAGAEGTPVLPVHGDLHVGQLLRDPDGRYSVIDFDGNPTSSAELRATPAPAARDVAQMLVSVENVEHVVRHYAPDLSAEAGRAWTTSEQEAFLAGYRRALAGRDLFDESLLPAYDWAQVCQEIVYAGQRAFLEWFYVPAAELRRRLARAV